VERKDMMTEILMKHKKECIGFIVDKRSTSEMCDHLDVNGNCRFFKGNPPCDDLVELISEKSK
jgi:hypothetical protein